MAATGVSQLNAFGISTVTPTRSGCQLAILARLPLLLILLVSGAARSEDAAPGTTIAHLTIATVNCRGLPAWISRDDPAGRIPLLLDKLAGFDVVLLQEDFAHQALVDAHSRQPTHIRANTGRDNGLMRLGDGLTLLTGLTTVGPPKHASYGVCHGWLSAANDCFSDKGYLMQRIGLSGGASIDVWTTHLDAGSDERDDAARRIQLDRLAAAIELQSSGQSIVVGGDFNLNWNDANDRKVVQDWLARTGLTIALLTPEGAREKRVDYLFARSGTNFELVCDQGGVLPDLVDDSGTPLTNHPVLHATCRIFRTKASDPQLDP